jgi:predicted ATPase
MMNESLTAGTAISYYRILSRLGAGGMGEVYLAEDTRLDRRVAIKLLPAEFTKDAERVRRFMQEARAASALNHPNIITVYDIGEGEAGRFIVMELVAGRTLRAVIVEDNSVKTLLVLGSQMAKALSAAHAAGITHRDIKPDNIMVRDDGYVKILDFGLARLIPAAATDNEAATLMQQTSPGALLGTVAYMSPEQARGESAGVPSDIFALGIIFYELATGQHPFKAGSPVGMLHLINSGTPLPPSRLMPGIPPALDALILAMLEKDARVRPTAAEVEEALQEIERHGDAATGRSGEPSALSLRLALAASPRRHTVGRERERNELRKAFNAAKAGRGSMVCVAGEPGLGKTTLVEDFLDEVLQGDPACQIARGRSSERLAGAEAYLPFLEALESLTRSPAAQNFGRAMKAIAPSWYTQLATSQDSSLDRVIAESPTASQERMKRELVAFLQEFSTRSPLVLFFDDLHWADTSTIDIIAYLATKLSSMRLLIVAAYRSSEMLLTRHPFLSVKLDMQSRGLCQEMPLELLTCEDVERFLALEFPGHEFPREFAPLIFAKTEGSPLFMADVVRYLRDRKVIGEYGGRWTLVQTVPEIETDLPESVRSMIERKIGRLGDEDRRLLVAASAQGYNFDSAVVAQALEMEAADAEERLQSLDTTHGFVKYREEDEFPDHTLTLRYQFVHVLYQNALYAALTPSRRASLSATIAKALLGFYGERSSDVASELAFLFQAARDWSQASDYFLKAARNATRVFANQEAVALSQRGLEMTARLPDSAQRTRQELKLQMTKGFSLMMIKGFAATATLQAFLRGRELSEQSGDNVQLFRALFGLAIALVVRGEYEKGRQFAEEDLRLAERCEDGAMMVQAHWALGLCLKYLGEFIGAREHFEQSLALYDHQLHGAHAFLYGAIVNRAHLARLLAFLGHPDQGQAMTQEALRIAARLRHPVGLCQALSPAIALAAFDRNIERVIELNEQMLFHADEHGLPHYKTIGEIMRGWVRAMQGEAEQGSAEMLKGLAAFRNLETEQRRASYLVLMADALLRAGRVDEGSSALDEAVETINNTGEHFYEAELYRTKGELLMRQPGSQRGEDCESEIEACLRKAIEIARRQTAKAFELRAVMSLARLWREQGKRAEAHEMLAEVYGWFTEGFDTADLKDARALLEN